MKEMIKAVHLPLGQHMWRSPDDTWDGKLMEDKRAPLGDEERWLINNWDKLVREEAVWRHIIDHAVKRGAPILAEVAGYGFSSNGGGISEPSDEGSVVAMSRALKDAGVRVDDVDYINAHATSTLQGDMYEAIALNRLFGGSRALISSTKSMTGHECWMAGASEVVYSVLMMRNNFVAPNINLENRDEWSEPLNLTASTVDMEVNTVLSNSFGFGGTNSALVIRKP